jgi:protein gp37
VNETKIRWTEKTWNPWSGCDRVSPGCRYCYAETLAEGKRGSPAFPRGFELTLRPHKLREPKALKKPALIFVNSMSDFFWDAVSDEERDKVLDVIEATPHEYQVLTKRPANALRYSRRRKLPRNFWIGVTIENQATAVRLDVLKKIEAEIRFVSAEPLLSPLTLDLSGIQWLISGGESGRHLSDPVIAEQRALAMRVGSRWVPREDRIDWVRALRDQCAFFGTAYLHKQWGGYRPDSAGHVLDGRTHDDYPRLPLAA